MPTMEQAAHDAQAFAENLINAAKDNPELRAKLQEMVRGPINAREKIEDLVSDLMDGNAGPVATTPTVVIALLHTAISLVYVDLSAQRGETRDTIDAMLDPLLNQIDQECQESGAAEMIRGLEAARERGANRNMIASSASSTT